MTVHVEGKDPELIEMPLNDYIGYEHEAIAVMESIQAGKIECDDMPLDESLAIIRTLDKVRDQLNYKYPFED